IVLFADVDPARVFAFFGAAGGNGFEGGAGEEGDFHVMGEGVEGEEPTLWLDAVEGGVPFDGFADVGNGARDDRVDAFSDLALRGGHGGDVGLDGAVAFGFGD